VVLGFTDGNGAPARLRIPLSEVGVLAMTLPDLLTRALRIRYGDHSLRYAYPLASWSVEPLSGPKTGMVTLCTTDGFSVCFSMRAELQQQLGTELIAHYSPKVQLRMN
jgi:hypothetical protein